MTLSTAEQQHVQDIIDGADEEKLENLKVGAENALAGLRAVLAQRYFSVSEKKLGEGAIEVLVRIECSTQKKGWIFRTIRRLQLVKKHLR